MASIAPSRPQSTRSSWTWLLSFLKEELTPYPGRTWMVTRMTVAATLVMLWIMVFGIPGAALGAYYTLLISRDSPQATFSGAVSAVAAIACGLCVVLFSTAILIGNPVLHFFWVIGLLFTAFYLISAMAEYRLAISFGFIVVTSLNYWEFPANTETRLENTLWTALAYGVAALTTIAVEFVSQSVSPHDQLREGIDYRMEAVGAALGAWGSGNDLDTATRRRLVQYATVGTARMRRLISRSGENTQLNTEMSATVALVGRLVDLSATISDVGVKFGAEDKQLCLVARDDIHALEQALVLQDFASVAQQKPHSADALSPYLLELQRTILLMPQIFAGIAPLSEYLPSAVDLQKGSPLWKQDAFTSPEHLRFALKATLAAGSCYVLYTVVDWQGLNTALSTVLLTAISTVGSSRQRQMMRVIGALFGALCLGMGSQAFLVPHMNSIGDFTLLFLGVTILTSWVATSSPRLSFAGLQTAFAFDITQLRTFGPQTSLTVARDDVAGIMLGLCAMWLCFDRLWVKDTAMYVMRMYIENLRRLSNISKRISSAPDLAEAVNTARVERNAINNQFDIIRNESDGLYFEFGANWQYKVRLRNQIRAWQPQLRTYFLLQISMAHYRLRAPDRRLPAEDERCLTQSQLLLRRLADWKESTFENAAAEPPDDLLTLMHESKPHAEAEDCHMQSDRDAKGISASMLNIAVGLANKMLADRG